MLTDNQRGHKNREYEASTHSEEGLAVSGPRKRGALDLLDALTGNLGDDVVNDRLGLEIEDLDARSGSSAEPVSVGGEDEGVDDVSSLKRVEVLAVVEVPKHGDTVLASGGGERSIGGDGDGVDVAGVAVVVGAELALGELPNLTSRCRKKGLKEVGQ